MDLSTHIDIEAVLRAAAAQLDAPTWKGDSYRRWVRGRFRGRAVTVVCWHRQTSTGTSGWEITSEVDAPPLLLLEVRKGGGSGAERASGTNDPRFDADWRVEAAPASAAKRIVDAPIREAIARLAPELHPPLGAKLFASDPLVRVDKGDVTVTCQGKYGEAAVLAGLELAVLVVERVATLAEERKGAPLSATQVADEEAQLARLRTKTGPLWTRLPLPLKVALVIAAVLVTVWGVLDEAGCIPRR
jgi:hypothetical protein